MRNFHDPVAAGSCRPARASRLRAPSRSSGARSRPATAGGARAIGRAVASAASAPLRPGAGAGRLDGAVEVTIGSGDTAARAFRPVTRPGVEGADRWAGRARRDALGPSVAIRPDTPAARHDRSGGGGLLTGKQTLAYVGREPGGWLPVQLPVQRMDDLYRAIADPTRRAILDELVNRDGQTLFELCGRLIMNHGIGSSRQAISQHLEVLESAGLVRTERRGRYKFHWFNGEPLRAITERWPSGDRGSG